MKTTEEKSMIEIPFGAKNSELDEFEYTIPDGFEAKIKDGKVIIKKKESEDEKTRKDLIDYIKTNLSGYVDRDRYVAWLEKQYADPIKEYWRGYNECKQNVIDKYAELEKQGEQKPVVTPKFKVGDIITPKGKKEYYTITDIVDEWYEFKERHVNGGIPIHEQFGWELVEQKPDAQHSTEWSVSDFRTWQYIVSDVLTKKDGIGQYLDSGECKKIAKYMQEEWGEKLSKEQTQEPQNKWKPSEEQLEALDSATENCAYSEYQDCLRELIRQLKKLKEE